MRNRKAYFRTGRAGAGRGGSQRMGAKTYNGLSSVIAYDRERMSQMTAFASEVFERFPALSKTTNVVGDSVKHLQVYYPLDEEVRFGLTFSVDWISPTFTGPANKVSEWLEDLHSGEDSYLQRYRLRSPCSDQASNLDTYGVMHVLCSGKCDSLENYRHVLEKLNVAVRQRDAA